MIGAAKAYKTVSTDAATVIAGVPPLDLVVDEIIQRRTATRNLENTSEMLGLEVR